MCLKIGAKEAKRSVREHKQPEKKYEIRNSKAQKETLRDSFVTVRRAA
jgi:hypothetical protein